MWSSFSYLTRQAITIFVEVRNFMLFFSHTVWGNGPDYIRADAELCIQSQQFRPNCTTPRIVLSV